MGASFLSSFVAEGVVVVVSLTLCQKIEIGFMQISEWLADTVISC